MERPTIERLASGYAIVARNIAVPPHFLAHFTGRSIKASLEIRVEDGVPRAVGLNITAEEGHLTTSSIRLPLTGELLPDAVAEASVTYFGADSKQNQKRIEAAVASQSSGDGPGIIGPITLIAGAPRSRSEKAAYEQQPRTGRPPLPMDELQQVAAAYSKRSKPGDVVEECPWLQPHNVYYRIKRCRQVGLLPPKDDRTT